MGLSVFFSDITNRFFYLVHSQTQVPVEMDVFAWWIVVDSYGRYTQAQSWNLQSGWWFGTFFIFPYIGNNHPN
jgi:hypothetical protein